MRAARLTPFTVNGGFRTALAEHEVSSLLRLPIAPSALVVANNLMVVGAIRAIRAAGLSIPGDIAIVAVDDPPWAELIDPPLTVVAQPVRKMAETAISMLLERIERGPSEPVTVVMPLELRIRESCGMRARPTGEEAA
jgi:DNA-binding LacI/PurR family transcriptional regulator